MKLIYALFMHAWFAISLKHDGDGMPTKMPAAFLLISLYIALNVSNTEPEELLNAQTLIAFIFITQFYLFVLRNKLIGLIILIGIIANLSTLLLTHAFQAPQDSLVVVSIMEYMMIFAAVVNFIKSNARIV